jgi:hypothetical protein
MIAEVSMLVRLSRSRLAAQLWLGWWSSEGLMKVVPIPPRLSRNRQQLPQGSKGVTLFLPGRSSPNWPSEPPGLRVHP